jgi:hypothetical protein
LGFGGVENIFVRVFGGSKIVWVVAVKNLKFHEWEIDFVGFESQLKEFEVINKSFFY